MTTDPEHEPTEELHETEAQPPEERDDEARRNEALVTAIAALANAIDQTGRRIAYAIMWHGQAVGEAVEVDGHQLDQLDRYSERGEMPPTTYYRRIDPDPWEELPPS